jgi:hypothetical protein
MLTGTLTFYIGIEIFNDPTVLALLFLKGSSLEFSSYLTTYIVPSLAGYMSFPPDHVGVHKRDKDVSQLRNNIAILGKEDSIA